MKKIMASILVAGMALVPIIGMAAGTLVPTPLERATKAAADTDSIYQNAKIILDKAQQEVVLTAANEAKAKEDLKIAEASGDKEKIKAATLALKNASEAAAEAVRKANALARQVERLRILSGKAKLAVGQAGSTDPKVAEKAADDAEALEARAIRISNTIEDILKPRPRLENIGVNIPTTTTSTTKPSPTPVGDRG